MEDRMPTAEEAEDNFADALRRSWRRQGHVDACRVLNEMLSRCRDDFVRGVLRDAVRAIERMSS